ncbi:glycine zipper 2TM domain-containing protein [Caulobacter segnis]
MRARLKAIVLATRRRLHCQLGGGRHRRRDAQSRGRYRVLVCNRVQGQERRRHHGGLGGPAGQHRRRPWRQDRRHSSGRRGRRRRRRHEIGKSKKKCHYEYRYR